MAREVKSKKRDEHQSTFDQTQELDRKNAEEKAQKDYEEAMVRWQKRKEDLRNNIVSLAAAIDESTDLSGDVLKLSDRVNASKIGSPLDKVEFEKAEMALNKDFALYIGRLKQAKKIVESNLEYAELNPPEAPA